VDTAGVEGSSRRRQRWHGHGRTEGIDRVKHHLRTFLFFCSFVFVKE
jgi:hypothetical protein